MFLLVVFVSFAFLGHASVPGEQSRGSIFHSFPVFIHPFTSDVWGKEGEVYNPRPGLSGNHGSAMSPPLPLIISSIQTSFTFSSTSIHPFTSLLPSSFLFAYKLNFSFNLSIFPTSIKDFQLLFWWALVDCVIKYLIIHKFK